MAADLLQRANAFVRTGNRKLADSDVSSGIRQVRILRMVIGFLGILLPAALVLGDWVFLDTQLIPRGSVSAYYYSGMRDILVGCISTTGVFLMAYRMTDKHLENLLSTVAGASAVLVAVLPTRRPRGITVAVTDLQEYLGENLVSDAHLGAAITCIGSLLLIILLFALREVGWQRAILLACALGMMLSIFLGLASTASLGYRIWAGEAGAVFFFGLGWLIKGAIKQS